MIIHRFPRETCTSDSFFIYTCFLFLRFIIITKSKKWSKWPSFLLSAVMQPFKQSKCSLVWTQNDLQPRMPIAHMRYQKILPQLVPWKRVTYWRRLMNSVSTSRNGSFSNIRYVSIYRCSYSLSCNSFFVCLQTWWQGILIFSRKLSMVRKRHTVYTRSTNGYSLRKSKVLSIGGSHLKWSKSIERDSRKANEVSFLTEVYTA